MTKIFVFIFILSSSLSLQAREIRAIIINSSSEIPAKVFLTSANFSGELTLTTRLSSPIEFPEGDVTLCLLRQPLEEGQKLPTGVPQFKIPATWSRLIIVCLQDPSNDYLPIKVIPINASPDAFKTGYSKVFNFSEDKILMKLGDMKAVIKPKSIQMLSKPRETTGSYHVFINYIPKNESKNKPLYRGSWRHYDDRIQLIFCSRAKNARFPSIRSVTDYIVEPPKEKLQ